MLSGEATHTAYRPTPRRRRTDSNCRSASRRRRTATRRDQSGRLERIQSITSSRPAWKFVQSGSMRWSGMTAGKSASRNSAGLSRRSPNSCSAVPRSARPPVLAAFDKISAAVLAHVDHQPRGSLHATWPRRAVRIDWREARQPGPVRIVCPLRLGRAAVRQIDERASFAVICRRYPGNCRRRTRSANRGSDRSGSKIGSTFRNTNRPARS